MKEIKLINLLYLFCLLLVRGCPKAYHPSCIKRDEAFFKSRAKWNCGMSLVVASNSLLNLSVYRMQLLCYPVGI